MGSSLSHEFDFWCYNKISIKIISLTFFLATLLVSELSAHEKHISFNHLTIRQGLSSNSVTGIVQDDKGFIWFGTYDGLNRYDGKEYKVFRHDPDQTNSLSGNSMRRLYKDRSDNLWLGTWSDGLNHFNRKTEKFTRYQHDPENPDSISDNGIRSIFEDKKGGLWVGTNGGGLNRLDVETGKFVRYRYDPENSFSLGNDIVYAVYEDRNGTLWIGTEGGGLNRFDRETQTFVRYQHDPDNPDSVSHNNVRAIFEDREGMMWIGTMGGGLSRFDRKTQTFHHYKNRPNDPTSLSDNNVKTIMEDQAGTLWVGTNGGGINLFDRKTKTFQRCKYNPSDPSGLNHNAVFEIYESRTGLIWIGTEGGGVNIFDPEKKPFNLYRHTPGNLNSLSYNDVYAVIEDQAGILWVGTNGGGLNRVDRRTHTFTHYRHDPAISDSLSYDNIYSLLEDNSGALWVGTFGGGLNRFNKETKTFTRYRHDPNDPQSLGGYGIMSLYEDRKGTLWVGTWTGGLNRLDQSDGKFVQYKHNPSDVNSPSSNTVLSIYEDQKGILWIGTMDAGLNSFDPQTGAFRRYSFQQENKKSLSHNSVTSIHEDNYGRLWIGTLGGGLNLFDRKQEQFIRYNKKNGLPGDVVYKILEDKQKHLWISTSQGLSKFDPQLQTFRNYDESDGLQGKQFALNAAFKSPSGEMFFGGTYGISTFFPEQIKDNLHVPPLALTNVLLANNPIPVAENSILQQSIDITNQLEFTYRERVFSFEFAALNYRSPQKNRYAFMLEGFDPEWRHVGTKRQLAVYTNIQPGEYKFKIIGSNNDGVWNREGASLRLIVTPPWWQRTWFKSIILVLFAGVLFFLYQRTINRRSVERQAKLKIEKQKNELKRLTRSAAMVEFTAALAHEIRQPLTAIFNNSRAAQRILSDDTPDLGEVHEILEDIGKDDMRANEVIRTLSTLFRKESLNLVLVDINELLAQVLSMVEDEVIEKNAEIIFNPYIDLCPVLGDRTNLQQLVLNLIQNGLESITKEAKSGTLLISSQMQDEQTLIIVVEDFGEGIDPEIIETIFNPFFTTKKQGMGMGLSICRTIIKAHGGRLWAENKPDHGAVFYFTLPIPKKEGN